MNYPHAVNQELRLMEAQCDQYWNALEQGWNPSFAPPGYADVDEMFTQAFYKLIDIQHRIEFKLDQAFEAWNNSDSDEPWRDDV